MQAKPERVFAVVASEVKNLANQTTRATEDIRVQVKEIREATNNAVVAIDQISETDTEVEHISGTIEEAVGQQGDTLDGIRDLKTSVMAVVRESTSSNYGNGEQPKTKVPRRPTRQQPTTTMFPMRSKNARSPLQV